MNYYQNGLATQQTNGEYRHFWNELLPERVGDSAKPTGNTVPPVSDVVWRSGFGKVTLPVLEFHN